MGLAGRSAGARNPKAFSVCPAGNQLFSLVRRFGTDCGERALAAKSGCRSGLGIWRFKPERHDGFGRHSGRNRTGLPELSRCFCTGFQRCGGYGRAKRRCTGL